MAQTFEAESSVFMQEQGKQKADKSIIERDCKPWINREIQKKCKTKQMDLKTLTKSKNLAS